MPILIPRVQTVTLDPGGGGTVAFSIDNTNQRWVITSVAVRTSQAASATPIPQADTYLDVVGDQGWQGGTFTGNRDVSTGQVVLYPDNVLYVVWTGGIPGSVASAVISGTFDPAGLPLAG